MQSWTSTGYFSNSTGSSATNCQFSPIIGCKKSTNNQAFQLSLHPLLNDNGHSYSIEIREKIIWYRFSCPLKVADDTDSIWPQFVEIMVIIWWFVFTKSGNDNDFQHIESLARIFFITPLFWAMSSCLWPRPGYATFVLYGIDYSHL
jgi:hypothetical protein